VAGRTIASERILRTLPIMVSRFEEALNAAGIADVEVRHFPGGTRTASDAANAVGCEVGQIVKSLVILAGETPSLALVSGANRLDLRRLDPVLGAPVRMAPADAARAATGYSIGGVPPVGLASQLRVFMDSDLLGYDVVWAAAGRPDTVFSITPARLLELTGAEVVELSAR
jgi:prolyl-tRNA editing enzyme YbaK/EbsC (Cys-tRNA(Pro) deacylase)